VCAASPHTQNTIYFPLPFDRSLCQAADKIFLQEDVDKGHGDHAQQTPGRSQGEVVLVLREELGQHQGHGLYGPSLQKEQRKAVIVPNTQHDQDNDAGCHWFERGRMMRKKIAYRLQPSIRAASSNCEGLSDKPGEQEDDDRGRRLWINTIAQ
jgi:hypothetical protein